MSFQTWHNYGYGICVDGIKVHSVDRLENLLALAPKFKAKIDEWLQEMGIQEPTWDNYMEYDDVYGLGLATLINEAIEEVEGISMTACADFEGTTYLMYQAKYPWELTDTECGLTKEHMTGIFERYVGILTDEEILIGEQSAANGG